MGATGRDLLTFQVAQSVHQYPWDPKGAGYAVPGPRLKETTGMPLTPGWISTLHFMRVSRTARHQTGCGKPTFCF